MSLNAFADGYNKGYSAGYDDATVDRAYTPARIRELEAEVSEARAEGYAAGRLEERAAVVAWLRAAPAARLWRQEPMDAAADALCRGEHLAPPFASPTLKD